MKQRSFWLIHFFLVFAALAQHGIDPHWATPTPVPKFNAGASATGAVANNTVVTNTGTVIIFYKENNLNYYLGSSDNGGTWSAPAPTLFPPATKTIGNSTISADIDLAGNIHTIWSAHIPSGLFYARRDALTQTWSDTLRISNSVRYHVSYSQLTTDRKNRLHVCWMDGQTQSNFYSEVLYSRSLDGGQSWSAPLYLSSDDNLHSAFPMPDFSGASSDTLGIAWRDSVGSSNWDILMAYTLDGGASWSAPLLVSGGSGIQSDPSLIVDKNDIFHLAHHEYPQGGGPQAANVKYGYSTDHGLSWTFQQISPPNVRSHLVKSAYNFNNDVVWFFWKDERDFVSPFDRRADIIGVAITNSGTTIGAPEFLSDGGSLEYGFHNFKVGPDGLVHAHFNTFYNNGTPSTIYYTRRSELTTALASSWLEMPQQFSLHQNFPNPFNPATVIGFQLPVRSYVTLKVFDVNGREVSTLIEKMIEAGEHQVLFDATGLASGLYFYQLKTGSFSQTRKAVLMR